MSTSIARHPPSEAGRQLVAQLGKIGPAALATLRRAAGRPLGPNVETYDIFRDLFRSVRGHGPTPKWVCEFIITLYPSNMLPNGKGSLAEALTAVRPHRSEKENRDRADQRLSRLLDCRERRALFTELLAAVRHLAQVKTAIDWARLFDDLSRWFRAGHPTQNDWATDYFQD